MFGDPWVCAVVVVVIRNCTMFLTPTFFNDLGGEIFEQVLLNNPFVELASPNKLGSNLDHPTVDIANRRSP
jgi:hypothetical protein